MPGAVENTPVTGRWWRNPLAVGVLLALVFSLWELPFASFMADDFIQLAVLEHVSPITQLRPFELYTLSDGTAQHIQLLKDAGAMPWFFDPGFKMAFFRPLSSASLVLDHAVFGLHPTGYRVHVALWFLVLVVALGKLYGLALRGAVSPDEAAATGSADPIATLALVIFTIAGFQAIFCWTATRHIAIAAALGVLAFYSHMRWREEGWRPGRILSIAGFVASLSASEAGLGIIAYLLAYEALGARGDVISRVRASAPVAGILALYLLMYGLLGLGASAGSGYLDPLHHPWTSITQIPGRLVFLVGAMLTGGDADLWVLRPDLRPAMIALAAVVALLGAVLLRAVWTIASTTEQRATAWMVAGSLLSAIPFAGSPIGSRCIIIPWIGGSVAVALVLNRWWTTLRQRPGLSNRLLGALCWGLAAIHLVLAPVRRFAVPPLLQRMMFRDVADAMEDLDLPSDRLAGRTLVILNAPDLRIGLQAYFFRQLFRLPMPAAWRVLSWASCAHRFRRTAADTLEMELVGGELEAPYLARGDGIDVVGMHATIAETGGMGPTRVTFRFDRPLDDPDLIFLMWKDGRLQPVEPPAIGSKLDLPWQAANPF